MRNMNVFRFVVNTSKCMFPFYGTGTNCLFWRYSTCLLETIFLKNGQDELY